MATEGKPVYIIGHKNPDTDSIASAIAYEYLKENIDSETNYVAARCGNDPKRVISVKLELYLQI